MIGGETDTGKGSRPRTTNVAVYRANFDEIDWTIELCEVCGGDEPCSHDFDKQPPLFGAFHSGGCPNYPDDQFSSFPPPVRVNPNAPPETSIKPIEKPNY